MTRGWDGVLPEGRGAGLLARGRVPPRCGRSGSRTGLPTRASFPTHPHRDGTTRHRPPSRDTPERVGDFAKFMHEKMIGLTGSAEQVKAASLAYKTYYRKNGEGQDYLVDHSTFTYLVLPEHGFVEFFKRGDTPEDMAKRTACFIDKS